MTSLTADEAIARWARRKLAQSVACDPQDILLESVEWEVEEDHSHQGDSLSGYDEEAVTLGFRGRMARATTLFLGEGHDEGRAVAAGAEVRHYVGLGQVYSHQDMLRDVLAEAGLR